MRCLHQRIKEYLGQSQESLQEHCYASYHADAVNIIRDCQRILFKEDTIMTKSIGTFGIDGDKFYLLWGDNLQTGHSYFANTIGEIRKYHLDYANRPLATGKLPRM